MIIVNVRLVFLRIGEINTLNEKYQAHASIESGWSVLYDKFLSNVSSADRERLINGRSITLKINPKDNTIYVCEYRIVKGLFWEKLELQHFPSDVQDLSISVTSMFFHNKIILVPDPNHPSGVDREAFSDQQEWSLYEHIDTEQRYIKEFLFRTDHNDEDDQKIKNITEDRKRSVSTITCHVARQPQYFFWDGFCLILLITLVSFCAFGLP